MKLKLTDKTIKVIMILGAAGILLLLLSTFLGGGGDTAQPTAEDPTASQPVLTNEEYIQKLEQKIGDLVKNIEGAGEAKIMITLQNGVEYVYVTEENINLDKTNNAQETLAERRSTEEKVLLVEDDNGRRKALLRTTLEPVVSGVVVICEGGGDIFVQDSVTQAVKTALNISTSKVCVTKLV